MRTSRSLLLTGLALGAAAQLLGADLPKAQPKYLTIVRESVKPGAAAAHAKHEAGWPAALEKAQSPDYYLAMTSMTGLSEAWYVVPFESHEAWGVSLKRESKDEALTKELDQLSAKDADFISSTRVVQAMARTDLSLGTFPDIGKARFFDITVFRAKPGSGALFEEASKAYMVAAKRANPDTSYRVYQVIAGMPGPAYIVFSSMESLGELDKMMSAERATWKGATQEELGILQRCGADALVEVEGNRFRLDPKQSYVPKEVRDKDQEFWNGK